MLKLNFPKFSEGDKHDIAKAVAIAVLSTLIIKTVGWGFDIYTAASEKHKERSRR